MKPTGDQLEARVNDGMSHRYFIRIFRNLIMCVVLSTFTFFIARDSLDHSLLSMLGFYVMSTVVFYIALGFGQIAMNSENVTPVSARAPRFYASLHPLLKTLFWIAVFALSFFAFYLAFHYLLDSGSHPEY